MKTYATQFLPNLTLDQIAQDPQGAGLIFTRHLYESSQNGWQLEQVLPVTNGLLVIMSHAPFLP